MIRASAGEGPGTATPLRRLPEPALPLAEMLSRVEHLVSRRVEQALGPDGPSLDQWRVLRLLADGDGHPMTGIATRIGVPAPTLTKIVDRLVDSALVHRRVDEADRRRVLVFLSDHGRAVHDRLAPAVARVDADLTTLLPGADAGRLNALLDRLLDRPA